MPRKSAPSAGVRNAEPLMDVNDDFDGDSADRLEAGMLVIPGQGYRTRPVGHASDGDYFSLED
jgi:hypothetical protein